MKPVLPHSTEGQDFQLLSTTETILDFAEKTISRILDFGESDIEISVLFFGWESFFLI